MVVPPYDADLRWWTRGSYPSSSSGAVRAKSGTAKAGTPAADKRSATPRTQRFRPKISGSTITARVSGFALLVGAHQQRNGTGPVFSVTQAPGDGSGSTGGKREEVGISA